MSKETARKVLKDSKETSENGEDKKKGEREREYSAKGSCGYYYREFGG